MCRGQGREGYAMVHTKMGKVSTSLVPTLEGGEREGERGEERGRRKGRGGGSQWSGNRGGWKKGDTVTLGLTLNSFVCQSSLVPFSLNRLSGSSAEVSIPMFHPPSERNRECISHSSIQSWQWLMHPSIALPCNCMQRPHT